MTTVTHDAERNDLQNGDSHLTDVNNGVQRLIADLRDAERNGANPSHARKNGDADDGEEAPEGVAKSATRRRSRRRSSCGAKIFKQSKSLFYIAGFLASWRNRMWSFAGAMFIIGLDSSSLRLPAIYGFAVAFVVLVFGASIGDFVDRTPRLRAVILALLAHSASVVVGGVIVVVAVATGVGRDAETKDADVAGKEAALWGCEAALVGVACAAMLSSQATDIAMMKDWIVVIAETPDRLAAMNSVTRAIDLTAKVLAPLLTGAILSSFGFLAGAVTVSVWTVISVGVEILVLKSLYRKKPALGEKKEKSSQPENEKMLTTKEADDDDRQQENTQQPPQTRRLRFTETVLSPLRRSFFAWATYWRHSLRSAGCGMAMLYLTVLGFDAITIAYAYSQGLCAVALGAIQAGGAVVGILGTLAYPILRRHFRLEGAGIVASALQLSFLSFCVVAVFLPGSPFAPLDAEAGNSSSLASSSSSSVASTTATSSVIEETIDSSKNETNFQVASPACGGTGFGSRVSIAVMMVGIVGARFGLWNLDLVIMQIFQERVVESQRGVVNGVLQSLCFLVDIVKFVVVVFVPQSKFFGYLVFLSFASVAAGGASYAFYAWKTSGGFLRIFRRDEKSEVGENDDDVRENDTIDGD